MSGSFLNTRINDIQGKKQQKVYKVSNLAQCFIWPLGF